MQKAIDLEIHLRNTERIALENRGKPQYLHPSGRPLADVITALDTNDRLQHQLLDDTDNPFINGYEGLYGF